jgi:hypothetical protein
MLLENATTVSASLWRLNDLSGVLDFDSDYDRFPKLDESLNVKGCKEWADEDDKEQVRIVESRLVRLVDQMK